MDDINLDEFHTMFDNIDDFLNFSCEDIEGGGGGDVGGELNGLQDVWKTTQDNVYGSGCEAIRSGGRSVNSEATKELYVPFEDIAQIEWMSKVVEDSFSAGSVTLDQASLVKVKKENSGPHQFRTSSPISVLDSSSSSSSETKPVPLNPQVVVLPPSEPKTMPLNPQLVFPSRPRSKRPRSATYKPRPIIPLMSPTSSETDSIPPPPYPIFDNSAESRLGPKIPNRFATEPKKRKKMKLPVSSTEQFGSQQNASVRKCLHCEITKTPQWRAGPLGPKTLCNACGVRYKSGRLFPEYRPAASPTFVSTVHSNSHKKVLEMRKTTKSEEDENVGEILLDSTPSFEGRETVYF